ncbi:MAG: TetR family transcriptional regulator [Oscillospiraceae bacterium]|nr:TetR family transcriptional regulator [Oscillospiraceae bacterium]
MPKGKAITTRMRIVDCAISLYKARGYANVTVHDICSASGLTRSAFYYHFNSKDEILDDYYLYVEFFIKEHLLPGITSRSYLEQFYDVFNLYLQRTIAAGPAVLMQILKRGIDVGSSLLSPREISMRKTYLTLIEKAQAAGQIRNQSPASVLLDSVLYIANGIALVWCSKQGKFDMTSEHHRILNTLFMVPSQGYSSWPLRSEI